MDRFLSKRDYGISPKGSVYKDYGDFLIILCFIRERLSHLIVRSIMKETYLTPSEKNGRPEMFVKKGILMETREALSQHMNKLIRGRFIDKDKVYEFYRDIDRLWEST